MPLWLAETFSCRLKSKRFYANFYYFTMYDVLLYWNISFWNVILIIVECRDTRMTCLCVFFCCIHIHNFFYSFSLVGRIRRSFGRGVVARRTFFRSIQHHPYDRHRCRGQHQVNNVSTDVDVEEDKPKWKSDIFCKALFSFNISI